MEWFVRAIFPIANVLSDFLSRNREREYFEFSNFPSRMGHGVRSHSIVEVFLDYEIRTTLRLYSIFSGKINR